MKTQHASESSIATERWRCADVVDWELLRAQYTLSGCFALPWQATAIVAALLAPFASLALFFAWPHFPGIATSRLIQLSNLFVLGPLGAFILAYAGHGIALIAARLRLQEAAALWRRTIQSRSSLTAEEASAAISALALLAARELAGSQGPIFNPVHAVNGAAIFLDSLESRMLDMLMRERIDIWDTVVAALRPTGIPTLCALAFSWAHGFCKLAKPPILSSDSPAMEALWRKVMPGQAAAFDRELLAACGPSSAMPLAAGSSLRI